MFGLFDLADGCWLGGDEGPFAVPDEAVARQLRELVCERLNWPLDRVEVRPSEYADHKRDELAYEKTLDEAVDAITLRWLAAKTGIHPRRLQMIEEGLVLQSRDEDRKIREALGKQ